mmetsp:Transcript_8756/g.20967  ORF Transcript_8756/g.20967 Transcript_8756/m.20967 type:complete len:84 (+) Transcript_8756:366-617(+)
MRVHTGWNDGGPLGRSQAEVWNELNRIESEKKSLYVTGGGGRTLLHLRARRGIVISRQSIVAPNLRTMSAFHVGSSCGNLGSL